MAQPRRLILGLGNPLAGDDGFGRAVVEALRRRPGSTPATDARDAGTDLLAEIETFGDYDEVVLVDAVLGAGRAGEVSVIDESVFVHWPDTSPGCHGISPLLAVKLFRRLHPEATTRIRLVALHASDLRQGQGVSAAAVRAGVAAVIQPFQTCGACRTAWETWDEFVVDPAVRLLGLQAIPTLPDASLLVFEHGCGSSVSILTKRLRHLLPDDPTRAGWPSLRGTDACPGHCRSLEDLAACDRPCSNARDRELIRLVQRVRRDRMAAGS